MKLWNFLLISFVFLAAPGAMGQTDSAAGSSNSNNGFQKISECLSTKTIPEASECIRDGLNHKNRIIRQETMAKLISKKKYIIVQVSSTDSELAKDIEYFDPWVWKNLKISDDKLNFIADSYEIRSSFTGYILYENVDIQLIHLKTNDKGEKFNVNCRMKLKINENLDALDGPIKCNGVKGVFFASVPLE